MASHKHASETLIYTESEDGMHLAGVHIQPAASQRKPAAITVVWVHGNTGSFYDQPVVTIGRELARQGYPFISGSTRGHHISATLWNAHHDTLLAGGSAWELLEEAPLDLWAWLEMAAESERVVLAGHGLGAAKVVYTQAQRPHPDVAGIILASPDLHDHLPPEHIKNARLLIEQQRGEETLPPLLGAPWYRLSAQNIASRAAFQDRIYQRTNGLPDISEIRCPVLAFFGTEGDVGGEAELELLRDNAHSAARFDGWLIRRADHIYAGSETHIATAIIRWIEGCLG